MNGTDSKESKRYNLNNQTGQENIFSKICISGLVSVQKYHSSNDLLFYKTLTITYFSQGKYPVLTCTKNEITSHITKMVAIRFAEINDRWFTKRILHVPIGELINTFKRVSLTFDQASRKYWQQEGLVLKLKMRIVLNRDLC
jgi:hypothetical protein